MHCKKWVVQLAHYSMLFTGIRTENDYHCECYFSTYFSCANTTNGCVIATKDHANLASDCNYIIIKCIEYLYIKITNKSMQIQ